MHPDLAWTASRTRALLGFVPGTTVRQADDVLTRADVVVLGVLADEGELLVAAPDSPDFSTLDATLVQLRSEPAVAYAAMDVLDGPDRLPPGADRHRPADDLQGRRGTSPRRLEGLGRSTATWNLETTRAARGAEPGPGLSPPGALGPRTVVLRRVLSNTTSPDLQGLLTVHERRLESPPCTDGDAQPALRPRAGRGGPARRAGTATTGPADAVIAGGTFDARIPGVDPAGEDRGRPQAAPPGEPVSGLAQLTRGIEGGALADDARARGTTATATPLDAATWVGAHPSSTCGPGAARPIDATGSGPRTPWT